MKNNTVQETPIISKEFIKNGGLFELMINLAEVHDRDLKRKHITSEVKKNEKNKGV